MKKAFDFMAAVLQIVRVQARGGPKRNNANLSNTARVAAHVGSCDSAEHLQRLRSEHHHDAEIHPIGLARPMGAFSVRLNPDTGSGHSRPETCGAILRGVLRLAVAIGPMLERLKHPPHRQHKENVRASWARQRMDSRRDTKAILGNRSSCAITRTHNPWQPDKAGSTPAASTKPCGFPFASHFRRRIVACPHQTRAPVSRLLLPRANAFTFPWGVALFSALVFRFNLSLWRVRA